jgi:asparagine synthase (glutamine-hydrolysing)
MCGIAGKLNKDSNKQVDPQVVRAMCQTISHRGPDDDGVYVDGPVGIGMRRLSIIDLAGGHQPLSNEDGSVWIVFNGEIYNYRDLRPNLEARGHRFATNSDTEVMVHLYEEHGPEFVQHLRGMFAIAIWDKRNETLVLVRDRLGVKPLYYAALGDRLVFGSELKPLMTEGVPRDIDRQALHEYLSYNYVPGPRTIFSAVKKLQPGHRLIARRGQVTVEPYWRPEPPKESARGGVEPVAHYVERLTELLKESIRYRLIADVPLGVFLSGGLDSSTVVAVMRQVSSDPIKTFSIGFEDQSFNELPYAQLVARHFETEHHEFVVKPDAVDLVPKLVHFFDEPFADSSAVPSYYLSELARQHVTVALGGDGGDEVFAGYETYAAYKMASFYRGLSPRLTGMIPSLVARLPVSHKKISFDYKAKRFVQAALLPPERAHYAWKEVFSDEMKQSLYAETRGGLDDPYDVFARQFADCEGAAMLSRLQYVDQRVYLADDILVKVDRTSMAHSLEAREPLLDHKLVEFAATIPPELQLRGLRKKYLLKRAMAHRLPGQILNRKKGGFNVPVPAWLRTDLRDYVRDVLSEKRLREQGFFHPAYVHQMIRDHADLRVDYSRNLWGLLIFALWHERFAADAPVTPVRAASGRLGPPIDPAHVRLRSA